MSQEKNQGELNSENHWWYDGFQIGEKELEDTGFAQIITFACV